MAPSRPPKHAGFNGGASDVEAPLIGKISATRSEESRELQLIAKYEDPAVANLSGFEKLKKFHKISPALKEYDASTPVTTLFHFRGTGLQRVLNCPDFWGLFILHVVLSIAYAYSGYGVADGFPSAPGWPKVNLALIAIPGSLTSFLLVFYLNQSFSRYLTQTAKTAGAMGILGEFVLLLRVHLEDDAFDAAKVVRHELWKLACALHVLALSMHPNYRPDRIDVWGWWFVTDRKLLTQNQVSDLKQLVYGEGKDGRLAFREVLMWTTRGIWAQQSKERISSKVAALFTYKLLDVGNNLEDIYNMPNGPVPFAYYHLLNLIVSLYLFLLAYAFVFVSPLWSIPCYFLILVALIGVRELGNAMSDPLGDDDTDIPVFQGMNGFLAQSELLVGREVSYFEENEELKPRLAGQ